VQHNRQIDGLAPSLQKDIRLAVDVLEQGGLILYPTDTVWGIGCDAFHEGALHRLRSARGVPPDEPLVVIVDSLEMMKRYVRHLHPRIETLLAYHQRPLTVICEDLMNVPPYLMGSQPSLAMRIVRDAACQSVVQLFGRPVVASIAAKKGHYAPSALNEVQLEIIRHVDLTIQTAREQPACGKPSVMVRYTSEGELIFLRK
jgi:L-threonylcarbamoyladenylate synthase